MKKRARTFSLLAHKTWNQLQLFSILFFLFSQSCMQSIDHLFYMVKWSMHLYINSSPWESNAMHLHTHIQFSYSFLYVKQLAKPYQKYIIWASRDGIVDLESQRAGSEAVNSATCCVSYEEICTRETLREHRCLAVWLRRASADLEEFTAKLQVELTQYSLFDWYILALYIYKFDFYYYIFIYI